MMTFLTIVLIYLSLGIAVLKFALVYEDTYWTGEDAIGVTLLWPLVLIGMLWEFIEDNFTFSVLGEKLLTLLGYKEK